MNSAFLELSIAPDEKEYMYADKYILFQFKDLKHALLLYIK